MTEPAEGHVGDPPPPKKLLLLTCGALAVATLVAVCFVFPAEYHLDPLGVGKVTGLDKVAGQKEVQIKAAAGGPANRSYPTVWRSDLIEIPLNSADKPWGSELEYKVRMKPGATLIYSWSTEPGVPEDQFYSDFHAQTIPAKPGGEIKVATYRQATGTKDSGSLIAALDGVHGWYLQNQSVKGTTVHLKIAGFYELVPPGQVGNEEGLEPSSSDTGLKVAAPAPLD
jgi:hypothetical protein